MQQNINDIELTCRKLGVVYEPATSKFNETDQEAVNRKRRINYKIKKQSQKIDPATIPDQPPLSDNVVLNEALDSVRAFEIEQMSYKFSCCNICHERRLEMLMANKEIC